MKKLRVKRTTTERNRIIAEKWKKRLGLLDPPPLSVEESAEVNYTQMMRTPFGFNSKGLVSISTPSDPEK